MQVQQRPESPLWELSPGMCVNTRYINSARGTSSFFPSSELEKKAPQYYFTINNFVEIKDHTNPA